MAKNISIIVLIGLIGFFGYMTYDMYQKDLAGKPTGVVEQVKQRAKVVMYSMKTCKFCDMATELLSRKGITIDYIYANDLTSVQEMKAKTGGARGVPQILIGGKHIGGWGELLALERAGKLNALLGGYDNQGN